MLFNQMHYLPLTAPFFSALVGLFVVAVLLIHFGILSYAYVRFGVSFGTAILLLGASLLGSYFNIPVAQLPAQRVQSGGEIEFFGMHYIVPVVVHWPGTIIAVNVGGALIPSVMAGYLLIKNRLSIKGALATAGVAVVCHWLATPVPGLGIAVPIFVPVISSAIIALLLSPQYAAQLAYIGGRKARQEDESRRAKIRYPPSQKQGGLGDIPWVLPARAEEVARVIECH